MINKTNTFKIGLLTFMLFCSSAVFAATVNVSTKAELEKAVSSASTPTEIIVASGNYNGEDINLKGNTAPVVIHPAEDFGAHFQSDVKIYGDFITIQKFQLNEVFVYGDDVKILRNIWDNPSVDDDWLNIEEDAFRTEVGYNLFQNRPGGIDANHQIIAQNLYEDPSEPYATHYHHNHFKNIAPSQAQTEIILIWSHGNEADPIAADNHILHEYNLYENAKGDGKGLDLKTNGCITRFNTFTGNSSTIRLRHGKRNTADSNVWLGGSGGIAANDRDHKIINNYIDGDSNLQKRGIHLYYGDLVTGDGYRPLINTVVENNTLVHCGTGLEMGNPNSDPENNIPLKDSKIKDNKFIDCGVHATLTGKIDNVNTTWTNNRYKGNGGSYASEMTEDKSLVAIPPSWVLTPSDVGPNANATAGPTPGPTPGPTVEPTGAFVIMNGALK